MEDVIYLTFKGHYVLNLVTLKHVYVIQPWRQHRRKPKLKGMHLKFRIYPLTPTLRRPLNLDSSLVSMNTSQLTGENTRKGPYDNLLLLDSGLFLTYISKLLDDVPNTS